MSDSQAVPGKKLKLQVHREDAAALQEQGQAFWKAIKGHTVDSQDRVVFQGVLMEVKATKPKGAIRVMDGTSIKMEVSKAPIVLGCSQCGQEHASPQASCSSCGQDLPLLTL